MKTGKSISARKPPKTSGIPWIPMSFVKTNVPWYSSLKDFFSLTFPSWQWKAAVSLEKAAAAVGEFWVTLAIFGWQVYKWDRVSIDNTWDPFVPSSYWSVVLYVIAVVAHAHWGKAAKNHSWFEHKVCKKLWDYLEFTEYFSRICNLCFLNNLKNGMSRLSPFSVISVHCGMRLRVRFPFVCLPLNVPTHLHI